MKKTKIHRGGLAEPFDEAASPASNELRELVRLMARIAADKDYNTLLEMSNPDFTPRQKKESNLDCGKAVCRQGHIWGEYD